MKNCFVKTKELEKIQGPHFNTAEKGEEYGHYLDKFQWKSFGSPLISTQFHSDRSFKVCVLKLLLNR